MSKYLTTEIAINQSSTLKAWLSEEQKALVGLSSKLTLAQLAPLIAGLFIASMVAGLGHLTFSAYMLVSTANITVFVAATGLMQALYYLFGRSLGRSEPEVYRATMVAARKWVSVLALLCMTVSASIGPVLLALGVEPPLAELAGRIGLISALGVPPMLSLMLFRIHASINGRAAIVSIIYIVGSFITALSVFLIFNFVHLDLVSKIEIVSASIVVANWVLGVTASIIIRRPPLSTALNGSVTDDSISLAFKKVWSVGWPVATIIFLEGLVSSASTIMVASFWPTAVPAYSIVLLWVTVGLVIPLGIAQATTQKISIAEASGELTTRNRLASTAIILAIVSGLLFAACMWAFPTQMGGFLLGSTGQNARFSEMMWLGGILLAAQSVIIVAASALRGIGITKEPLIFAVLGYVVISLGGSYLAGIILDCGIFGMWLGLLTGFIVTAIGVVAFVIISFSKPSPLSNRSCDLPKPTNKTVSN